MDYEISTNIVAHKVLDDLKSRGIDGFTLRPYNQFRPEDTLWWLVPSTEWPAFKYGKIAVFKDKKTGVFGIGPYFEKGFSDKACQVLNKKGHKQCMQDDWIWHDICRDIHNGNFEIYLNKIIEATNKKAKLVVRATPEMDKSSVVEDFEIIGADNAIEFIYDGSKLTYIDESATGEMRVYRTIDSIGSLTEIFEVQDMEWYWIDFYAVIEAANEDWEKIPDFIPVMINSYREVFEFDGLSM